MAFDRLLHRATLLVSFDTVAEITAVLARPKFDRFIPVHTRQIALAWYVSLAESLTVDHVVTDCRDPTDNKFRALAFSGRANLILTGDEDLLVLHPWRSIPILSPAAYLTQTD